MSDSARRLPTTLWLLVLGWVLLANSSTCTTSPALIDDGFTMMIATYRRDALLPDLLTHLTTDPPRSLRHIVLIWQNINAPLPDVLHQSSLQNLTESSGVAISVRMSKQNSMNERFRPLVDWGQEVQTEAVMIMDDDVILRRGVLEWGYQQFRAANPLGSSSDEGRIVGFSGRDYSYSPEGQLVYNIVPKGGYSMVLSNAAWFRREWLQTYWSEEPGMSALRDYVDEVFNCDDLLINFVVSNITRLPPLLLQPSMQLRTVPTQGLWNRGIKTSKQIEEEELDAAAAAASGTSTAASPTPTKPNHFQTRPLCLQHFFDHYALPGADPKEGYPLLKSTYSVSQDLVDHARWLTPNEAWEEPTYTVMDDEFDDEEEDYFQDDGGAFEEAGFQAMLDKLSPAELEAYVAQLEADQEAEELELEELRAQVPGEGERGGGRLEHLIDEL